MALIVGIVLRKKKLNISHRKHERIGNDKSINLHKEQKWPCLHYKVWDTAQGWCVWIIENILLEVSLKRCEGDTRSHFTFSLTSRFPSRTSRCSDRWAPFRGSRGRTVHWSLNEVSARARPTLRRTCEGTCSDRAGAAVGNRPPVKDRTNQIVNICIYL